MQHDAAPSDTPPPTRALTTAPVEPTAIVLDEVDARQIAHETGCDLRTIRRVIRGDMVRGVKGAEIARAVKARLDARRVGADSGPTEGLTFSLKKAGTP